MSFPLRPRLILYDKNFNSLTFRFLTIFSLCCYYCHCHRHDSSYLRLFFQLWVNLLEHLNGFQQWKQNGEGLPDHWRIYWMEDKKSDESDGVRLSRLISTHIYGSREKNYLRLSSLLPYIVRIWLPWLHVLTSSCLLASAFANAQIVELDEHRQTFQIDD